MIEDYSGIIPGQEESPMIAGISSGVETKVLMPMKNWSNYRPVHEVQYKDGYETWACTIFSGTDCLETLLNFHMNKGDIPTDTLNWLKYEGYIKDGSFNFSDRYAAQFAEIVPMVGTYMYKAANSVCANLIPEEMLPYVKNDNYFNKSLLTVAMAELSAQFFKRITINWFYVENKSEMLGASPLQCSVRFANGDGILKPEGRINHAVMCYGEEDSGNTVLIDDSYASRDKKYGSGYVNNYIGYKITFNDIYMDNKKFIEQNDLKWVRNETTGQFGRIMQGKLRPIVSSDRGALILLDEKLRGNKVILDGKEHSGSISNALWESLPKLNF